MSTSCPEKAALRAKYDQAIRNYTAAADDLQRHLETGTKAELDALRSAVDQARLLADEARTRLHAHTVQHGCPI